MTGACWWGEGLLRRGPDDELRALADRAVTRGELRSQVRVLAAHLAAEGIGAGSSVAIRMPPSLTLLAAWSRKAQVILLDARLTAYEVGRLLRVCEPQFLLYAEPLRGMSYLVEDVPFTVERRPSGVPATDDVCLIQVSSGSTGTPKVIGRTASSLLQELERYTALDGMPGARDRVVLLNSVIHTMGLVGGILHGLNSGAQMVFPSRLRAGDIIEAVRGPGLAPSSACRCTLLCSQASPGAPCLLCDWRSRRESCCPARFGRSSTSSTACPSAPCTARRRPG
ncbi:hypothetical protein GCM10009654_46020 [Streptomyces hebeiensis]|uniref:AMP-dependent synthetase/ligase domain-containing protein n=1 Tax=Streptomyces hebeiensis TaxID=229486 RepID=A0ABN1V2A2_9ACTN